MSTIFPGRFTAKLSTSFVVFVIGLRVSQLLQFGKWISGGEGHAAHD
jgi:hypothetical protein